MYVYNYYNYYNCFQGGTPKAFLISEISLQDGTQVEGSKQSENKEEKSAATKKVLKKKKKPDGLLMGSGSKKHKGMNNLVAKWNKVNKHADTALK